MVEAVYRDPASAPVRAEVRAALRLVKTVTMTPAELNDEDFLEARQSALSDGAIDDVVLICVLFNVIDRLADAFGFFQPDERGYREAAKMLLKQGYDLPPPLRWSNSVD